jgi:hypothetical protein
MSCSRYIFDYLLSVVTGILLGPFSELIATKRKRDDLTGLLTEWMISISLNHGKNGEKEECASAI